MKVTGAEFQKFVDALTGNWHFVESPRWYTDGLDADKVYDLERNDFSIAWKGSVDAFDSRVRCFSVDARKLTVWARAPHHDGLAWFVAWCKTQANTTLAFDVPYGKREEIIAAVANLGGKLLK